MGEEGNEELRVVWFGHLKKESGSLYQCGLSLWGVYHDDLSRTVVPTSIAV